MFPFRTSILAVNSPLHEQKSWVCSKSELVREFYVGGERCLFLNLFYLNTKATNLKTVTCPRKRHPEMAWELELLFEAAGDFSAGGHLDICCLATIGWLASANPNPPCFRHWFWSHQGLHQPPLLTLAEDSAISLIRTMIEECARSHTGSHPLFPGYLQDSAPPRCNHISSFHGHLELNGYHNSGIYRPLSFSLKAFDQSKVISSYCI